MKKRNLIVKGITAALVFCLVYGTTLIYHNEFKSFSVVALEDNSNWNEAINGTYCICPMYTVVNLRSDTSLNSDIVCSIPQGTNFTVTAVNGEWAKVEYNGKNGYIMYDHITKAVWDGSYDTSWYDDQDDKLYIFTAAELAGLAHLVNESGKNFDGITIYIENDIDLSGGKWTPIGEYPEKIFKGTFDCQNHSIKNIAFSYTAMNDGYVPKGSGLFGYCEGSIKNTTIDNCMISTSSNFYSAMGGVCGVLSNGSIENCVVSGIIKSSNYSSSSRHQLFVGGIVGDIQGVCTINQCKSTADVTIQGDDVVSAGGICGSVHGDSIINECASLGKTYSHATNGGGGYYADGSVAPQEQNYSGGICGKVYEGSLTIKNSYNQGKVESNSTDTDIKGNIHEYECSRAGGIIGELNKSSSIYDSYNTGEIIGYYSGAITVLREQETILENVYYLSSCCKIGIADGIDSSIAKSMLNLKKEAFVEKLGDKFTYSENNYPKLKWEVSTSNNNEIGLSSEKSSLCIGESTQLSVSNYTGNITWISSDTEVAKISVDGIVTGAGEGNATIYAILESGKSLCCNIHVIKEAFILGDINGDNDVNISDVVELQKWLLAVSDTEFANWQAADICKDGIINGFDLVALKEVVSSEN